jgi:ABC-type phosphate/phosphonate transport system substrate-binding protein
VIANARMYAAVPAAEAAWREIFARVAARAGVSLDYVPHKPPAPLEDLWARPDLGAVFMCGWPWAMRREAAERAAAGTAPALVAAPRVAQPGGGFAPLYRTLFVVAAASPARSLADTFGGTLAWTVEHSHSGFNAPRHHLLAHRRPDRPLLYARTIGPLVTPRRVIDAVLAGEATVGPLDSYWATLLERHEPETWRRLRVVDATAAVAIPPIVAAPDTTRDVVARLADAFRAEGEVAALALDGFAVPAPEDYAPHARWAADARAAGYDAPG